MTSRTYDYALAATVGDARLLQAMGSRCKVVSAPHGSIQIRTDTGAVYELQEGQGFNMPPGQSFRELFISNPRAVVNVGTVFVGDQTFVDDRITGTVQIVDGERNKVGAGVCFRGAINIVAAATRPAAQLWNPAGSGKNVIVQAVRLGAALADQYGVQMQNVALPSVSGNPVVNLDSGQGAGVAQLRQDNTGAALGTQKPIISGYIAASSDVVLVMPRPMLLRPGNGALLFVNTAGAQDLKSSIEWEEWPI